MIDIEMNIDFSELFERHKDIKVDVLKVIVNVCMQSTAPLSLSEVDSILTTWGPILNESTNYADLTYADIKTNNFTKFEKKIEEKKSDPSSPAIDMDKLIEQLRIKDPYKYPESTFSNVLIKYLCQSKTVTGINDVANIIDQNIIRLGKVSYDEWKLIIIEWVKVVYPEIPEQMIKTQIETHYKDEVKAKIPLNEVMTKFKIINISDNDYVETLLKTFRLQFPTLSSEFILNVIKTQTQNGRVRDVANIIDMILKNSLLPVDPSKPNVDVLRRAYYKNRPIPQDIFTIYGKYLLMAIGAGLATAWVFKWEIVQEIVNWRLKNSIKGNFRFQPDTMDTSDIDNAVRPTGILNTTGQVENNINQPLLGSQSNGNFGIGGGGININTGNPPKPGDNAPGLLRTLIGQRKSKIETFNSGEEIKKLEYKFDKKMEKLRQEGKIKELKELNKIKEKAKSEIGIMAKIFESFKAIITSETVKQIPAQVLTVIVNGFNKLVEIVDNFYEKNKNVFQKREKYVKNIIKQKPLLMGGNPEENISLIDPEQFEEGSEGSEGTEEFKENVEELKENLEKENVNDDYNAVEDIEIKTEEKKNFIKNILSFIQNLIDNITNKTNEFVKNIQNLNKNKEKSIELKERLLEKPEEKKEIKSESDISINAKNVPLPEGDNKKNVEILISPTNNLITSVGQNIGKLGEKMNILYDKTRGYVGIIANDVSGAVKIIGDEIRLIPGKILKIVNGESEKIGEYDTTKQIFKPSKQEEINENFEMSNVISAANYFLTAPIVINGFLLLDVLNSPFAILVKLKKNIFYVIDETGNVIGKILNSDKIKEIFGTGIRYGHKLSVAYSEGIRTIKNILKYLKYFAEIFGNFMVTGIAFTIVQIGKFLTRLRPIEERFTYFVKNLSNKQIQNELLSVADKLTEILNDDVAKNSLIESIKKYELNNEDNIDDVMIYKDLEYLLKEYKPIKIYEGFSSLIKEKSGTSYLFPQSEKISEEQTNEPYIPPKLVENPQIVKLHETNPLSNVSKSSIENISKHLEEEEELKEKYQEGKLIDIPETTPKQEETGGVKMTKDEMDKYMKEHSGELQFYETQQQIEKEKLEKEKLEKEKLEKEKLEKELELKKIEEEKIKKENIEKELELKKIEEERQEKEKISNIENKENAIVRNLQSLSDIKASSKGKRKTKGMKNMEKLYKEKIEEKTKEISEKTKEIISDDALQYDEQILDQKNNNYFIKYHYNKMKKLSKDIFKLKNDLKPDSIYLSENGNRNNPTYFNNAFNGSENNDQIGEKINFYFYDEKDFNDEIKKRLRRTAVIASILICYETLIDGPSYQTNESKYTETMKIIKQIIERESLDKFNIIETPEDMRKFGKLGAIKDIRDFNGTPLKLSLVF